MKHPSAKSEEDFKVKIFALLSYLSFFCIIPLILKKDNSFVLVHGKQGLVLFVLEVASFLASIILPIFISNLIFLLLGGVSILGIIEVLKGKNVRMPFISEWANKITL